MKTLELSIRPLLSPAFPVVTASAFDVDLRTDRMLIGQGFNSVTGEALGMSVVFRGPEDLTTASGTQGNQAELTFDHVESLQQLRERLNLSAAASFGFGIFGGDLAASYLSSGSYTRYNSFLFLDIKVTNPAEVLIDPNLTDNALRRVDAGADAFLSYCGDSYVYGRITGGQFTVLIQFSTTNSEHHQQVDASLRASVAGYGNGTLTVGQALTQVSNISETHIHVLRRGSDTALPAIADVVAYAHNFPTLVARQGGKPAIVSVLTRSYQGVGNFPIGTIDFDTLADLQRKLQVLREYIDTAYEVRGDLKFIGLNLGLFDNVTRPEVDRAFSENERIIRNLRSLAAALITDPNAELPAPPDYPRIDAHRKPPPPIAPIPIPPIEALPVVELFEHVGFGGRRVTLNNSIAHLADAGFNDLTSSFKVNGAPGEYHVEFFKDWNFDESMFSLDGPYSVPNMHAWIPLHNFGDKLTSVRITKKL